MFLINREEIYKIEVAHRRLQPYIKGILRTYGGTFEDYVSIKEAELARNLRTSVAYVKNALLYMHKYKMIDYVPQTDEPKLTFTLPRANANNLIIDQKILDFRKKVQLENIAGIISYAENAIKCRSKELVAYFGEFDAGNCGLCDICLRRKKLALNNSKFEKITTAINQLLTETPSMAFAEVVTQLTRHYGKEDTINTLRWLADNRHIIIDAERMIRLRKAVEAL
jgi:ATP-dependent DNA helicase RecQ